MVEIQNISKVSGLIPTILFGPVTSRRLGRSLGINLLPPDQKICQFNCPYCECGFTDVVLSRQAIKNELKTFPSKTEVIKQITEALITYEGKIDHLTFAGNGEPTIHPEFPEIIDGLLPLKKTYPHLKIAVLTNATTLDQPKIKLALEKCDSVAYKLDAGDEKTYRLIDAPVQGDISLDKIIKNISKVKKPVIQSMFIQGRVDNTTPESIEAWIKALKMINPIEVQIYSLDRNPADGRLIKVAKEKLLGVKAQAEKSLKASFTVY
jgi:wyosine [tRNA(Phe)-imidazoG37] synthetase (radical SAM superfamily)